MPEEEAQVDEDEGQEQLRVVGGRAGDALDEGRGERDLHGDVVHAEGHDRAGRELTRRGRAWHGVSRQFTSSAARAD